MNENRNKKNRLLKQREEWLLKKAGKTTRKTKTALYKAASNGRLKQQEQRTKQRSQVSKMADITARNFQDGRQKQQEASKTADKINEKLPKMTDNNSEKFPDCLTGTVKSFLDGQQKQ